MLIRKNETEVKEDVSAYSNEKKLERSEEIKIELTNLLQEVETQLTALKENKSITMTEKMKETIRSLPYDHYFSL